METILEGKWRKFNGSPINVPIKDAVEAVLIEEARLGNEIKVCIGSDSQVYGRKTTYATVILFHRKGRGGFMFINTATAVNKHDRKRMLKERLLTESVRSIEIAYHLCELFDKHDVDLEVHADINTNPRFKSNDSLSEAMGYILGMGFTFKAKPEAYAASYCANKVC